MTLADLKIKIKTDCNFSVVTNISLNPNLCLNSKSEQNCVPGPVGLQLPFRQTFLMAKLSLSATC